MHRYFSGTTTEYTSPMGKDLTSSSEPYLPDFHSVSNILFLVLTVELLVMAISLAADFESNQYWTLLGLRSLYAQWLALASAFSLTVLRGGLTRYFGAVGQSVAMLLIVATWTLALSYVAHMVLHPDLEPVLFLFRNLAISLILTGLLLRYLYVQHLNKVQEAAETRSRFQALQSRIRPHFLFNSMNTIASLTRLDPIKAEQVVEDLADLFRASLTDAEKLATLDEELDLARRYLNIERIRLGDRIRIEWKVADLPKTAVLPRLTLQPLLENAVYHGIEKHPEGGEITLCGSCQHGVVELKLCNPLFHEEISASGREKHGIALNNVKQRLETLFGVSGRLLIKEDRDRYCVTLNFPDTLDEDSHSR